MDDDFLGAWEFEVFVRLAVQRFPGRTFRLEEGGVRVEPEGLLLRIPDKFFDQMKSVHGYEVERACQELVDCLVEPLTWKDRPVFRAGDLPAETSR